MFWNLPAPPWFPIYLSLKVAGLVTLMALITGVAVARYQMRKKTMRSKVLDALCTLPMILPPTVLGYYLILIIGRRGVLGHWLQEMGIQLIFTWQGAVVAARDPGRQHAGFRPRHGRVRRHAHDRRQHSGQDADALPGYLRRVPGRG